MSELSGAVLIVTDADTTSGAANARAIADAGARAIVLCGRDGVAMGSLARDLQDRGTRIAVFLGDSAADAGELSEMVHELFLARRDGNSLESRSEGDR